MKKQALGVIIMVVVLATVLRAGCTTPTTQNNTIINNISKKSNHLARSQPRNNITAQFNTIAGNASKTLYSIAHEAQVVVHFLNALIQLVIDTTQDLHSSASSTSISMMTIFPHQRVRPFYEE